MTIDEIKSLINSNTRFTKNIKERITEEAAKYNIIVPTCGCKNRWKDTLVTIYHHMKKGAENINYSIGNIYYKKTVPVRYAGKVYSKDTPPQEAMALRRSNISMFNQLFAYENS